MCPRRMSLALLACVVTTAGGQPAERGPMPREYKPQWQRKLAGKDLEKAKDLHQRIAAAEEAGKQAEALRLAEEALAFCTRLQGADHFQVRDAQIRVADLKGAPLTAKQRAGLGEHRQLGPRIEALRAQRQYRQAIPLAEKARAILAEVRGENHPDYAHALIFLAGLYLSAGDSAKTEALHVEARDILKRRVGQNHPEYAYTLSILGSLHESKGEYAKAERCYLEARDCYHEVAGEGHAAYAVAVHNLAYLYESKGEYTKAEPLYREARDLFKRIYGENDPEYAVVLNNLAHFYQVVGDLAKAEPLYLEATDLRKRYQGENHPDYATSLNNLAGLYEAKGDYAKAEPLSLRALDLCKRQQGEKDPQYATRLSNLAMIYHAQGDYAKAEPLFLQARDLRKTLLGETHPLYAQSLNNLAAVYVARGEHAKAVPLHLEARDLYKRIVGDSHPDYGTSVQNLSALYESMGDLDKAEPLVREAREVFRRHSGESHPHYPVILSNLAGLCYKKADLATAERFYLEVQDLYHRLRRENHPYYVACLDGLATLYTTTRGDHARAEPLYLKARDLCLAVLGENHPHYGRCLDGLATLYQRQGDHAKSEACLRESQRAFEMSRLTHATGLDRAVGLRSSPYGGLAAARARLGQAADAFAAVEMNLARAVADEQARRRGAALPATQEGRRREIVDRLGALNRRILHLSTLAKPTEAERTELASLQEERRRQTVALARIAAEFSQSLVETPAAIRSALDPATALVVWVDDRSTDGLVQEHWACVVRSTGDPRWELLPYTGPKGKWSLEDDDCTRKLRFALRGPTATTAEIDTLVARTRAQRIAPVLKHLQGVRRLLVVGTHDMAGIPIELLAPDYQVEYVPSGTAVARASARPKYPGGNSLLAVGDPVFRTPKSSEPLLPPGGLLVQAVVPGGAAENLVSPGDVLLRYGDTDLTDVESLSKGIAANAGAKTVLVKVWRVADGKAVTKDIDVKPGRLGVNLDKQSARDVLAARHQSAEQIVALTRSGRVDPKSGEKKPWTELPATAAELDRITKLFDNADLLGRSSASEQKLEELRKGDKLKGYRYLHFATHGLADSDRALESFLVLAQDKLPRFKAKLGEKLYNGELSAREVLDDWKLDADLVTLSACESALGRSGGGDGLLGFTQAFLLAGARSVCLSLWEVDDNATALLMIRFYQNLLGKRGGLSAPMKKAAALREAKEWLRNLTAEEVLKVSGTVREGVSRGKGELPPPELTAKAVAPGGDLKVKPYADPRFWAAFILVGDPD